MDLAVFLAVLAAANMHEEVKLAGVALLVAGLWVISLAGQRGLRFDGLTLFFAFGTSIFVATYTIIDGIGGRISGAPLGYAGLVFVFDAVFLSIAAVAIRGPGILREVAPCWKTGVPGALLSGEAYWIAIWAMTHAPIASVAAPARNGHSRGHAPLHAGSEGKRQPVPARRRSPYRHRCRSVKTGIKQGTVDGKLVRHLRTIRRALRHQRGARSRA